MINYIEKFLLVIFGIKKKPLCEERLLFYVSVSHSLLFGICSASSLGGHLDSIKVAGVMIVVALFGTTVS